MLNNIKSKKEYNNSYKAATITGLLDIEGVREHYKGVYLVADFNDKYKTAVNNPNENNIDILVTFLKANQDFFRQIENDSNRQSFINIYRNFVGKNDSFDNYLKLYALTHDKKDILNAIKLSKSIDDKKDIELTIFNSFRDKSKFFDVIPIGDNFLGKEESQGGNLFIMNIGASGIKDATADIKIKVAKNSPMPIRYGSYNIKMKFILTSKYETKILGQQKQEVVDKREKYIDYILNESNNWEDKETISFGELVQGGGGAVFGLNVVKIKLVDVKILPIFIKAEAM